MDRRPPGRNPSSSDPSAPRPNQHEHAGHTAHDGHTHHAPDGVDLPPALDVSVPDDQLQPRQLSRRSMIRRAGLLGAGAMAGSVVGGIGASAAAAASGDEASTTDDPPSKGYVWLAGDHHIHTRYSNDGKYRVIDQVRHANAYGLDWMVITDHGNLNHSKIGVEKVNPDIVSARKSFDEDLLIFQGLEWNIPAAEHGTVFVHPGSNEVAVLKEFETGYDGSVKGATGSSPANEALAIAGVNFLAAAKTSGRIDDALFLANHPARKGIDSPHEIRGWRDAQPSIAIGMEGAPGHQAAGYPAAHGMGRARGLYDNSPSAASFAGYPLESYRTFGGFDWMTATVGGLWDSLLAEGKPWWITANSDSHNVYTDFAVRGANSDYDANGYLNDPVNGGIPDLTEGDFWPGFYSRTTVGAKRFSYAAVMDALRAGRIWVDHGGLIAGLDVQVRPTSHGSKTTTTLGGTLTVSKGSGVELVVAIDLPTQPNWAQFVPALARVDVIVGEVTGAASDRDTLYTSGTKVVTSIEVAASATKVQFTYPLGKVDHPFYLRLRGTDGKRSAPGLRGAAVDPAGPAMDVMADADPWNDLWFYTNPIWVVPRS